MINLLFIAGLLGLSVCVGLTVIFSIKKDRKLKRNALGILLSLIILVPSTTMLGCANTAKVTETSSAKSTVPEIKVNPSASSNNKVPEKISMKLIPTDLNIAVNVSEDLLFRTGVNTDLLYIAVVVGGGFKRPPSYLGSNDKYGFNSKVKSYFSSYSNTVSAKKNYESALSMDNPPKKFAGDILNDLLKYDDMILFSKSNSAEGTMSALEQFTEDSKAVDFFGNNQLLYKNIIDDLAKLVNFNYIQRLEAFGQQP
jgi:hypothetical protein